MTDPVKEALEAAAMEMAVQRHGAWVREEWIAEGHHEKILLAQSRTAVLAFLKKLRDNARANLKGRVGEVTSHVWEISYLEERISQIESGEH